MSRRAVVFSVTGGREVLDNVVNYLLRYRDKRVRMTAELRAAQVSAEVLQGLATIWEHEGCREPTVRRELRKVLIKSLTDWCLTANDDQVQHILNEATHAPKYDHGVEDRVCGAVGNLAGIHATSVRNRMRALKNQKNQAGAVKNGIQARALTLQETEYHSPDELVSRFFSALRATHLKLPIDEMLAAWKVRR